MSAAPAGVAFGAPASRRPVLATLTVGLLWLDAAAAAVIAVLFVWASVLLFVNPSPGAIGTWTDYLDPVATVLGLASLVTPVVFLVWLFRAVASVRKLGLGDRIASPWMAVVWWFVPVAWFFLPYRVVRDLHARLAPDDTTFGGRLVPLWWAAWLGSWLLYAVTWVAADGTGTLGDAHVLAGLGLVFSLSLVAVAALAAKVVRTISDGQRRTASVANEDKVLPLTA